jgi:hypothetical protein
MATLTEQDLKDAAPLAEQIFDIAVKERPVLAVVALARAFAAVTHLAECGPNAALVLFHREFDLLGKP